MSTNTIGAIPVLEEEAWASLIDSGGREISRSRVHCKLKLYIIQDKIVANTPARVDVKTDEFCEFAHMRFFRHAEEIGSWICTLPIGQVSKNQILSFNPPVEQ